MRQSYLPDFLTSLSAFRTFVVNETVQSSRCELARQDRELSGVQGAASAACVHGRALRSTGSSPVLSGPFLVLQLQS